MCQLSRRHRVVTYGLESITSAYARQFLHHLNDINPHIQFTSEEESVEGTLPFLDVCVHRESDGSISTSIFRKATHTDQHLAFNSHHPVAHKAAVVRTLVDRAHKLSSTCCGRTAEERRVVEALQKNGYPTGFIHRYSNVEPRRESASRSRPKTSLTVPYISELSETLRRILLYH